MKNKQPGFSLLEMLIALLLVALMMSVLLPSLRGKDPRYERNVFVAQITSLLHNAWQRAVVSQKVHRVVFMFQKNTITVTQQDGVSTNGDFTFGPIKTYASPLSITIPAHIKIKQFIIEGVDEIARFSGGKITESWIYCMPEGLAQPLIINMIDTKDVVEKKPRQFSLVLNPFSGISKYYDTFQAY